MATIMLIVTIALAWWQYPEKYVFFMENISVLGGYYSESDIPNWTSLYIIVSGLGICGFLGIIISIIYFVRSDLDAHIVKGILYVVFAIGAAGLAVPRDQPGLWSLHALGALVFILAFSIFNFFAQVYRFIRKHRRVKQVKRNLDWYVDFILVWLVFLVIIFYVTVAILSTWADIIIQGIPNALAQKVVLITCCFASFFLDIDDL
jgi:hypothetical protein